MTAAETELALHARVDAFYRREAMLLQGGRYREWLNLIDNSIVYRVPTHRSIADDADCESERLGYYDEDHRMLEARVAKLESKFSWVEHPPSRLRYFTQLLEASIATDGMIDARCNVLLFQHRWNLEQYFSAERRDRLADHRGTLRLISRTVYLDREILGSQGLAVLF